MVEGLGDVLAKSVSSTTRGDSPSAAVVGVRPQQVTHGPLVRHFLDAVEGADVIEGVDAGRQATVQTEDLVVNQGGQGQVVKEVGKELPDVGVAVFPQALVVKAVDLSDLTRLVVSTQDGDALRVSDFESDEQGDRLDRVVASIDVISHE